MIHPGRRLPLILSRSLAARGIESVERQQFSVIGKRVPKYDGVTKVTGRAVYADDIRLAGMLHGQILRSPLPHARILHIDSTRAQRLPGVKAVITGADTPRRGFGYGKDRLPLQVEKVRCVGDEVAAVAAVDEHTAREAVELIRVEYEPLPVVFDPLEAMQPGAPLIHQNSKNNVSFVWRFREGDVDAALQTADVVLEDEFRTHYINACPIETHTCVARFEANGDLTVWAPIHFSNLYRRDLSELLGLHWAKVRIIQTTFGGSFGSKIDIESIDLVTVLLAQKTGRPVKIVFSRDEEFVGTRPRQPMIIRLRTGASREGKLLARDVHVISDNGAYNAWGSHALFQAMTTFSALYRVAAVNFVGEVVYTNKPYGGSIRGFGNPQATFAVESHMDMLAERLGMDAVELRLKNANQKGDVTPQEIKVTSCGLAECIEEAAERIGWDNRQSLGPNRAVGLAALMHVGGGARIYKSDGCGATVKVDEAGGVTVISGATELGQGGDTVQAQIAAEVLGARIEDVTVVNQDTAIKLWDVGAHASRSTFIAGNAVRLAALKAKEQLMALAARKLEARVEDLEARNGRVFVRGSPDRSMAIGQVVRYGLLRVGGQVVIASHFYDPPTEDLDANFKGNMTGALVFGCHSVEVEVDRATGRVDVKRVVAAHDLGRAINPMAAEGQIEGGAVMALGFATSEELLVKNGAIQNTTLLDYRIPTVADVPQVETVLVETIDPEGPFGAKGLGETSTVPLAAAIANAVYQAIGVRIKELPITPEKILRALDEAGK